MARFKTRSLFLVLAIAAVATMVWKYLVHERSWQTSVMLVCVEQPQCVEPNQLIPKLLSDPVVSKLSIMQSKADPARWLQERLGCKSIGDSNELFAYCLRRRVGHDKGSIEDYPVLLETVLAELERQHPPPSTPIPTEIVYPVDATICVGATKVRVHLLQRPTLPQ